jgi:AAA domain
MSQHTAPTSLVVKHNPDSVIHPGFGEDYLARVLPMIPVINHHDPLDENPLHYADDDIAPLNPDRLEIERYKRTYRLQEIARREVRAELAAEGSRIPLAMSGPEFLSEEDEDPEYLISRLWTTGGNVLLVSQAKSGKTTLIGNLLRSLCDGDDFLGAYQVAENPGRVLLLDFELSRPMARRWLKDQHIRKADRFEYMNLTGQASAFDVMTPAGRECWASAIGALEVSTVIVDCLSPILLAAGLDENHDGRKLCEAVRETVTMAAGICNLMIVHHMGHSAERPRGDSGLRGWADEWRLVKQDPDDSASPRYLSAYGRDIDIPETRLDYEPVTRHLVIGNGGSRRDAKLEAVMSEVLEYVRQNPGVSGNKIDGAFKDSGYGQKEVRDAYKTLAENSILAVRSGARNAKLYYPGQA